MSQTGIQRVDQSPCTWTIGAHSVKAVDDVGEADVSIRITKSDRAADAVVAE